MANERGTYGKALIGAYPSGQGRGSSLGTWIVGGVLVGGAVLWARHQSGQIAQLYKTAGLPHQSFGASVREQTRALTTATRAKIHDLTRPALAKKEI